MNIYEFLAARQRKTAYPRSGEPSFFREHAHLLSNHEAWEPWMSPKSPFEVIRSNIIIRSLLNKNAIEKLYFTYERKTERREEASLSLGSYMKSGMSDLPYLLVEGKRKVYVPFFPKSLNLFYESQFEKLGVSPYRRLIDEFEAALVDPFDYYGHALFDSYFTRLVPIKKGEKLLFAYDYDAESAYLIDEEGRLEVGIALFDDALPSPSRAHMAERLLKVAEAYFAGDREGFYGALVSTKLISGKTMGEYLSLRNRLKKKEDRRDG